MIVIKNTQRKIVINTKQLKKDAQTILRILHYDDFDLGILLTNNSTIQKYNREYRHKDKPTDVLSFSYHPTLKAGKRIKPKTEEDYNLGDLVISAEYVLHDNLFAKLTLQQRLQRLLVHGVCHLLGYDHIVDQDWRKMRAKEGFLLKKLAS